MTQNHLIGHVSLDFRASRQTDGFALQNEVSNWFWQQVLPELSRTLDEVIPPDLVIRLDQVAIELSAVSKTNWKEKLTTAVCRMVAEEIVRRRLFPQPSDEPVEEVSPTANSFEAWLDFIRTGHRRLSVAAPSDWPTTVPGVVATPSAALSQLKQLLQTQPIALERLVRQYDDTFLTQLAEALTGRPAQELLHWQTAFRALFAATWWQTLSGTTSVPLEAVARNIWILLFEKISTDTIPAEPTEWIDSPDFLQKLLERITRHSERTISLAVAIAHFFQHQFILNTTPKKRTQPSKTGRPTARILTEIQLRQAMHAALQDLPERERLANLFDRIIRENSAAVASFFAAHPFTTDVKSASDRADYAVQVPSVSQAKEYTGTEAPFEQVIQEKSLAESLAEGEVYYVPNAGIVLLHPFLSVYLRDVGLQAAKKTDRRRAVRLIHYLATGERKTPEYDLLLPKVLAGWPISQPIDGAIRLTKLEKTEAKSLLQMLIGYWGALGSTSADGLREGFLQREGRLTQRDNGWLLQVEKQTHDILLDQLPWGIGVIKHDWMTDFLYVEWY